MGQFGCERPVGWRSFHRYNPSETNLEKVENKIFLLARNSVEFNYFSRIAAAENGSKQPVPRGL